MKAKLLREAGYEEAMLGISLSWASNVDRAVLIAPNLAHKQGGHNKFLESIMIWVDVTAPRYWWQEFDTYRVGVTKQSESTMHTLTKRKLTTEDFEGGISRPMLQEINNTIAIYGKAEDKAPFFMLLKQILPEGFLQRRIVCMSYKTLQNMYSQRKNHKLPEWKTFFGIVSELEYEEFIR